VRVWRKINSWDFPRIRHGHCSMKIIGKRSTIRPLDEEAFDAATLRLLELARFQDEKGRLHHVNVAPATASWRLVKQIQG